MIKRKLRRAAKSISVAFGVMSCMLFAAIGICDSVLADEYRYDEYGTLSFAGYDYITARGIGEESQAISGENGKRQLMLFEAIPIKEVTASSVEPPMLAVGGEPFGIKLEAGGAVVVGFYDIDGACPARECGLSEGDVILSCGGEEVHTNQAFADAVMRSGGEPMELVILRNNEQKTLKLSPAFENGSYRAGAQIRDSCAGIGTVSFYDTQRCMLAGLGHAVCDSTTGEIFPCSRGEIAPVEITGIRKSEDSDPGELQGVFTNRPALGRILRNGESGIYGSISVDVASRRYLPLGFKQDIERGYASIICTLSDGIAKEYDIEIEKINLSDVGTKNMVIKITDPELIDKAGGIVQGMSGSPIIQDGKIVGAVTHVFVKDTCRGYAIFAENMYDTMLSVYNESGSALDNAA